jgi:hypothetical protein
MAKSRHQTPSRAARKARKASHRRRNDWMPRFASFTARRRGLFSL